MEIFDWPIDALVPSSVAIYPEYVTRPGQEATNGMRRAAGLSATRFRLSLIDIPVNTEKEMRLLRSLVGLLEGDTGLIRVRLPNFYGIDGPFTEAYAARKRAYPNGVPFASDVLFSDDVGFAVSYRNGTLAELAGVNARTVYVNETEELPAGCLISIDEMTYLIRRAWYEGDGVNRVELSPPLRRALPSGTDVDYAPVFVGYCVTDRPGSEPMNYGRYGRYSLDFVEDLTRLVDL